MLTIRYNCFLTARVISGSQVYGEALRLRGTNHAASAIVTQPRSLTAKLRIYGMMILIGIMTLMRSCRSLMVDGSPRHRSCSALALIAVAQTKKKKN